MRSHEPLDVLPLWAILAGSFVLVMVVVELGYRLGQWRHRRSEQEKETPVEAMVGAILGLLAFLLAFTFNLAASRYDLRRELLLDEANAIGTTYLRAAMVPEPHRSTIRDLLRQYVDLRLKAADPEPSDAALERSEAVQNHLWLQAVAVAEKSPTPITSLFVQSLNELIDLHAKRVNLSLRNRIPFTIWITLYLSAVLAMTGVGYHAGLSGTSRTLAALILAVTFALILWLIADLDRPQEGLLKVSQQALVDVQKSMMP